MNGLQELESVSVITGAIFGAFGSLLICGIFIGTQWSRWKKFLSAEERGYFDNELQDRISRIEELLDLSISSSPIRSGLIESFERALESKIDNQSRVRITTKTDRYTYCLDMAGDMMGGSPYAVWKTGGQRYGIIEKVVD